MGSRFFLTRLRECFQVHPVGFEPTTFGSVDRCSIQLSYGCSREGIVWLTPRSVNSADLREILIKVTLFRV